MADNVSAINGSLFLNPLSNFIYGGSSPTATTPSAVISTASAPSSNNLWDTLTGALSRAGSSIISTSADLFTQSVNNSLNNSLKAKPAAVPGASHNVVPVTPAAGSSQYPISQFFQQAPGGTAGGMAISGGMILIIVAVLVFMMMGKK